SRNRPSCYITGQKWTCYDIKFYRQQNFIRCKFCRDYHPALSQCITGSSMWYTPANTHIESELLCGIRTLLFIQPFIHT
ncbi:hypothetical protein chiPu_0018406, partial [Chiloscyllium punctatum]|nr:hypothetical protein [Chiloscyllium punctatum]